MSSPNIATMAGPAVLGDLGRVRRDGGECSAAASTGFLLSHPILRDLHQLTSDVMDSLGDVGNDYDDCDDGCGGELIPFPAGGASSPDSVVHINIGSNNMPRMPVMDDSPVSLPYASSPDDGAEDDIDCEDERPPWRRSEPPRLSLGSYGGALSTIDEAPRLEYSRYERSAHRLSASLTVPSRTQPSQNLPCIDLPEDEEEDDESCPGEDDVGPAGCSADAGLIVDFPHNERDGQGPSSSPDLSDQSKCDSQGRCVRHPHVRLRKKKKFGASGEWKVLMKACPDCCVEEMLRICSKMEGLQNNEDYDEGVVNKKPITRRMTNDTASITHCSSGTSSTLNCSISNRSLDSVSPPRHVGIESSQDALQGQGSQGVKKVGKLFKNGRPWKRSQARRRGEHQDQPASDRGRSKSRSSGNKAGQSRRVRSASAHKDLSLGEEASRRSRSLSLLRRSNSTSKDGKRITKERSWPRRVGQMVRSA